MNATAKAEQIALDHWRWMKKQKRTFSYDSIYIAANQTPPASFEGGDGIVQLLAEIWLKEAANGRDT